MEELRASLLAADEERDNLKLSLERERGRGKHLEMQLESLAGNDLGVPSSKVAEPSAIRCSVAPPYVFSPTQHDVGAPVGMSSALTPNASSSSVATTSTVHV